MASKLNNWNRWSNAKSLNANTEAVAKAIWDEISNKNWNAMANKPNSLKHLWVLKTRVNQNANPNTLSKYYKPKPSIFNRFKGLFGRKPAPATTVSVSTPAVSSENNNYKKVQERVRQLKLNSIASHLRVVSKVKKWHQRAKTAAERKIISKNITARAISSVVAAGKYNNMNVKNLLSEVSGVSNANKNALRRAITAKKLASNITPDSIYKLNNALKILGGPLN
jgi:hypothetical protein